MISRQSIKACLAIALVFFAGVGKAITVPGSANLWLAGQSDGVTASVGDVAPDHSPVLAADVEIVVGNWLSFTNVSGLTNSFGACPGPACFEADGDTAGTVSGTFFRRQELGVGGISAPLSSVIGVFLGSGVPFNPPATDLDFSSIGFDFLTLSPLVQQPFFIGNGKTSGGVVQAFQVPLGATRLYIGTMDTFFGPTNTGHNNNTGAILLDVSVVPEPATNALLLSGLLLVVTRVRRSYSGTQSKSNKFRA